MSKKRLSRISLDDIPTYFHLDFEKDRYEFAKTPLLNKLCIGTEGSVYELETKALLYESLCEYCSIVDNLMNFYENGMEGNSEAHLLMYILSADKNCYIPLSVRITFLWNEEKHWADEAIGTIRIVKKIPTIARCVKCTA